MAFRVISALTSAVGVLVSTMLLILAVHDYRSGASALWIGAGVGICLVTSYTLVRDVRRLRAGPTS